MVGLFILAVCLTLANMWLAFGGIDYINDWGEGVKKLFKRK